MPAVDETDIQPPAPETGSPPAPLPLTPSTPVCERCHRYAAAGVCRECGLFVCTACAAPDEAGNLVCQVHRFAPQPVEEPTFRQLLRGLLSRPQETYAKLSPDGRNLAKAFVFAVVLGMFAVVIGLIWEQILPREWVHPIGAFIESQLPMAVGEENLVATVMALVMMPFFLAIGVLINALGFHLALMLVGGAKKGIGATIKVVCYSNATAVFAVLPLLGSLVFWFGSLYLTVIGAAKLHGVSPARVFAALALFIGFLALIVGLGMAAFMALMSQVGGGGGLLT
ncbi:MAG: YIP1 family protein [Candidatus Lernaella stagnicola]|nr:YIP1 family protein [Candidatus Lernaella stagnicola]